MTVTGEPYQGDQSRGSWESLTPLQKILDIIIILLTVCFFALPLMTNAVGEQADSMCKPNWDYSVPCTNGQEKEVDGKEVIGGLNCFCEDTTCPGGAVTGECTASDHCNAEVTCSGQAPEKPTAAQEEEGTAAPAGEAPPETPASPANAS